MTHNSHPNAPDRLTVDGGACVTGAQRPDLRTLTPQLKARVSDPDGDVLKGTFSWWPLGGSQSAGASGAGTGISRTGCR